MQHQILNNIRNFIIFSTFLSKLAEIIQETKSYRGQDTTEGWEGLWQCKTRLPGCLDIKLFDAICLI